ncbi:MAG TPA: hypothetical protein VF245_00920 [Solirubrobacterales bacterium]
MGERFRLKEEPGALRPRLETSFACLDEFSGADDLHRVLDRLREADVLECPTGLEIVIYPSSAEDNDVALITVLSTANPQAHVVAASEELRKLATRELWGSPNLPTLTLEIVENTIELASGAIAAVRGIEARDVARQVAAPARCPCCGAENQIRLEYRYDVVGLARDSSPVLAEGCELTDIFCLACGEEVSDIEGPKGLVFASGGGECPPSTSRSKERR